MACDTNCAINYYKPTVKTKCAYMLKFMSTLRRVGGVLEMSWRRFADGLETSRCGSQASCEANVAEWHGF